MLPSESCLKLDSLFDVCDFPLFSVGSRPLLCSVTPGQGGSATLTCTHTHTHTHTCTHPQKRKSFCLSWELVPGVPSAANCLVSHLDYLALVERFLFFTLFPFSPFFSVVSVQFIRQTAIRISATTLHDSSLVRPQSKIFDTDIKTLRFVIT